jgi:mRNA interferase RelE/StbE
MVYKIKIVSSAERQFLKLSVLLQDKLSVKILSLAKNPRPFGNQKLRDSQFYRIRIGDYRIIYSINDKTRAVEILDIGHRREIYR